MPRVATFCPRCGEAIETEVPEEARALGRAQLECPACRFRFVITPAQQAASSSRSTDAGAAAAAGSPEPVAPEAGPDAEVPDPPLPEARASRIAGRERNEPRGALPARLLAAGLLLVFAAALGFFFGGLIIFNSGLLDEPFAGDPGSGVIMGRVVNPNNRGLANVTVELLEAVQNGRPDLLTPARATTTTDNDGGYRFEDLDPGSHWVRIEAPGYRTAIHEVGAAAEQPGFASGQSFYGLVMMRSGEPGQVEYGSQVDQLRTFASIAGWVMFIGAALATMGAILCFMRRSFALATIGAIGGIFTWAIFVGSVFAVIALIIILLSRRQFRPLRRRGPPAAG